MNTSRSHRLIHVIITVRGPGQYKTNNKMCFRVFLFIVYLVLINTIETQKLPRVESGTSGLLAFDVHTEP